MNFDFNSILLGIVPVLAAITMHEAAHGWMAKRYGDSTAFLLGRVTLNPIPHIDPIGTVLIPIILIAMGSPFLIGWAKPVPIISRNFKNTRIGIRMSALAGPLANILMLLFWAVLMGLGSYLPMNFGAPLIKMATIGILINAFLFAFNMFPILPLDGGRVLDTFLPIKLSRSFQKVEPYGMWIVIGLVLLGGAPFVIWPVARLLIVMADFIAQLFS